MHEEIRGPRRDSTSAARDQSEGQMRETKGRVKESWGALTGNERLRTEGRSDQMAGASRRLVPRDHLLLVASVGQFALFAPLAWWAHKHPQPPIEVGITHVLQKKQPRSLQVAARVLSTIAGSAVLMNILVVPTALLLWKRHLRLEAVMTVGISWTSALVRMVIQGMVDRPRPSPLFVHITKQKRSKSFPSGHVAASLDFWGWLFSLGMILSKGTRPWQKGLLCLPALCVVLVGPSRIYLGDHWSTDVLGGYLFGGGWLGLSLRLYLALRHKNYGI